MPTMDVILLRATDRAQKSLRDAEAWAHFSVEALALAAGSLLGAVFGSVAGPPGALAGAVVGGGGASHPSCAATAKSGSTRLRITVDNRPKRRTRSG